MKKQQHFNKPQLRSMYLGAPKEMFVAGRATGKTVGVGAIKTAQCYFKTMPRGTGVFINATFTQAFTRTLKELVRGWQMLGYRHEHHFIIGRRPPDKWRRMWNWEGPFATPFDWKYFISWYNGAVGQIVSQERIGSSNGVSIDFIFGDEAKLLNHERMEQELFPANRGLIPAFAGNPYHHGWTFITDMPIGSSGRWVLDMAGQMDMERINELWRVLAARYQVYVLTQSGSDRQKKEAKAIYDALTEELKVLRKNLLYYHEASTLDNIHALGVEYIKEQLRSTDQLRFDTQILNLRPLRLEDGFYPDFDEDVHGYFEENRHYFDNSEIDPLEPVLDCRKDIGERYDINAPLHMGMDYNRRIHPIAVLQPANDELRVVNGMHAMFPGKLKEAVQLFCDYYKPHRRRVVHYWYDHTAIGDQHETRICDDVMDILKKNKWIVIGHYIGQQPGYEERYRMWANLLTESGKYRQRFRINRENCGKMILSIQQAETDRGEHGFRKSKKTEADPKFPADESTHYTDALDTPVFGILESKQSFGNESKGNGGFMMS